MSAAFLGCHLSTSGGYLKMVRTAHEIGATTLQCFTRNPRGGQAAVQEPADVQAAIAFMTAHGFGPIVFHAPYTLNPCGAEERVRRAARELMADDFLRMRSFPGQYYNFHPGSHVGQGAAEGIRLTTALLNELMTPEQPFDVLIETMSGKGTEIGGTFEEVRRILDGAAVPEKIGVCLDTCHISDAGYDLAGGLEEVLETFDRVIGLARLKAVHLNDSMNARGARKDRHAVIGGGCIGLEALSAVFRHPALAGRPFVLETPNDLDGYAAEIALLRNRG